MKRDYYLFSNGRLCRRQNTLCLERATDARSPGAEMAGVGSAAGGFVEAGPQARLSVRASTTGGDGAVATAPVVAGEKAGDKVGDRPRPTGVSEPTGGDDGRPTGEPTGEKIPFPIESVASIFCFGEIDVNSKLVSFLSQHQVPLHFFDYYGHYRATLYPKEHLLSGRLTVEQVRHYDDPAARMQLARAFVDAAMGNIRRVLSYYATRTDGGAEATLDAAISAIETLREQADDATDTDELMGLEGRARRRYYRTWPAILGEAGADFPFDRRTRQPPSNALNALISFGNTLCYTAVLNQLYHTALDPTVSYLHEPGDRRYSLALDLAEVFKPLLVDRAIFRLVKTRQIQPSDFEERLGGVYLRESGRKTFVGHWDDRLRQTVKHRRLGRSVSYQRLVRLDAYRLVRHLCDPANDPYDGFAMWW
jgi:CRISPR-associated protein Cas1